MNRRSSTLTPVPSSDALEAPSSSQENMDLDSVNVKVENRRDMPSPITPAELAPRQTTASPRAAASALHSSPSRKVCGLFPSLLLSHGC